MAHLEHPSLLPRGKSSIANIIAIIHIIMNIIQSSHIRATILTARTPTRRHLLYRRIRHRVPSASASLPLKNVEKTEPVAHFMGSRPAEVVVCGATPWNAVGEDVAAVFFEGGGGAGCASRGGEVADSEEAAAEVGEKIYVQVGVGAFTEG